MSRGSNNRNIEGLSQEVHGGALTTGMLGGALTTGTWRGSNNRNVEGFTTMNVKRIQQQEHGGALTTGTWKGSYDRKITWL